MPISYVGGQVGSRIGTTATSAVTFSLTGGSNSTPQAGDLVVVTLVNATQDVPAATNISTPSGYTNLTSQVGADGYEVRVGVAHKRMGATPDTSVTLPSTGGAGNSQAWAIQVFRGVDATTPMDVTPAGANGGNSSRPNPPAITPVTAGAWVVICGGGAAATGANYVAPTNFTTNFLTTFRADTNDALVGSGYWSGWSSGAVDPAAYTGGSNTTSDAWGAHTLALRPEGAPPTISAQPQNVTANAGGTAQFSVTASNATSYQWQVSTNGGSSWANVSTGSGGTTATYTTPTLIAGMTGYQYRVNVTNASGTTTSSAATLTVTVRTVTLTPASSSVEPGSTVVLTANVTVDGSPSSGATVTASSSATAVADAYPFTASMTSNASTSLTAMTGNAGAGTSPSGASIWQGRETTATDVHQLWFDSLPSFVAGDRLVFEIEVRPAGNSDYVTLYMYSVADATFAYQYYLNFATGVLTQVSVTGTAVTALSTDAGSGWRRVVIVMTAAAGADGALRPFLQTHPVGVTSPSSHAGVVTDGFDVGRVRYYRSPSTATTDASGNIGLVVVSKTAGTTNVTATNSGVTSNQSAVTSAAAPYVVQVSWAEGRYVAGSYVPSTYSESRAEPSAATETQSATRTNSPSLTESATAVDTQAATRTIGSSLTEPATAVDTAVATRTNAPTVAEPAAASEAQAASRATSQSVSEPAPSVDVAQPSNAIASSMSEAAVAGDALSTALVTASTITEVATSADAAASARSHNETLAEASAASDAAAPSVASSRSVAEPAASAEVGTSTAVYAQPHAESATAGDLSGYGSIYLFGATESSVAADTSAVSRSIAFTRAEPSAAIDTSAAGLARNASVAEAVLGLDAAASTQTYQALVAEVVDAIAPAGAVAGLLVTTSEPAAASDDSVSAFGPPLVLSAAGIAAAQGLDVRPRVTVRLP